MDMPSTTAVVVIDMLNPYDHEDADALAAQVEQRVDGVKRLIEVATDAGATLIYANDNFGDFTATREDITERAMGGRRPDLVEPILPLKDSLFVQKVRHSAFYSTSLEYLLREEEIETVVLAGQVTEQCILYSALDAYVRHFSVDIPVDAVAPIDPELGEAALTMMERNMGAKLVGAESLFGAPSPDRR
jgi:nicotinamidase-related amidase